MELFAGQFRPNGKPFLAHLLGTASILASLKEKRSVVLAGLLHSSYSHGEFGDGSRGVNARKKAKVRAVVGEEIEKLVACYSNTVWDVDALQNMRKKLNDSQSEDREILTMNLANLLEEFLDHGMAYCSKKKLASQGKESPRLRQIAVLTAKTLGHHSMAVWLDNVMQGPSTFEPPTILQSTRNMSFTVVPKSYRKSTQVKLAHWLRQLRQKFSKPQPHPEHPQK